MNIYPTVISKIAPVRKKMGKNRYQVKVFEIGQKNVSIVISTFGICDDGPERTSTKDIFKQIKRLLEISECINPSL